MSVGCNSCLRGAPPFGVTPLRHLVRPNRLRGKQFTLDHSRGKACDFKTLGELPHIRRNFSTESP